MSSYQSLDCANAAFVRVLLPTEDVVDLRRDVVCFGWASVSRNLTKPAYSPVIGGWDNLTSPRISIDSGNEIAHMRTEQEAIKCHRATRLE